MTQEIRDHRESWAALKTADGTFDHNKALTGDDLKEFVDQKLFPYPAGFKQKADSPNTIEYKIGEIFNEIRNKLQSGYTLRDVLEVVDTLRFQSQDEKHELSHLYEAKIKNMGNAGRNGGDTLGGLDQHDFVAGVSTDVCEETSVLSAPAS
jgi:type I restriction enzyme M protein